MIEMMDGTMIRTILTVLSLATFLTLASCDKTIRDLRGTTPTPQASSH
jgi:hypothetical protein